MLGLLCEQPFVGFTRRLPPTKPMILTELPDP